MNKQQISLFQSKKTDDWQTPVWLYDSLNKEFNFDFDPEKQMIKMREGGLVQIDNMRESMNLFTDPKAFGDDEYRQDAIREALEAGVISFNFNQGGVTDPPPKPPMIDYVTQQDYKERAGELFDKDDLYGRSQVIPKGVVLRVEYLKTDT